MGLDMYVRKVDKWNKKTLSNFVSSVMESSVYSVNGKNNNFNIDSYFKQYPTTGIPYGMSDELCYWRKHPYLHGWMKTLFYEKGGSTSSDFNHDVVFLTKENVLQLKKDVEEKKLPKTAGFFFGESYPDEEEYQWRYDHDMDCIKDMLFALSEECLIYYSSSW